MNRREFVEALAVTSAGLDAAGEAAEAPDEFEGYALQAEFANAGVQWKAYEDLRTRNGTIVFLSARGARRFVTKSAEPAFATADPPYLGLKIADIGMSGPDLLADKLLAGGGDPDPEQVRSAAPPLGSAMGNGQNPGARVPWNAFVGTRECFDTMPVFPAGNTRTYHPNQYFEELRDPALIGKRFEGMLGGWLPSVRKVFPLAGDALIEMIVFGDVEAKDRFIVQTWHRTARIVSGKVDKVVYGYSYPAFPPARKDPEPAQFYRALLVFAEYWDRQIKDMAQATTPQREWIEFSKHAFAKELMVRPGGVYPKYGAVDRDYYGPEYDGFQDIFTASVSANLEWGRFEQTKLIIDNFLTEFTDNKGMINMRGPETAQFGLTLSLLARYFNYTQDSALLLKHRGKIEATADMLGAMEDIARRVPATDAGYGLIAGWSESDACLAPTPEAWWKPYYANSAFSARGLRDIATVWGRVTESSQKSAEWKMRADRLQQTVIESVTRNIQRDKPIPYVPLLPGSKLTFRESMATERPSPQQWPHRPYAELLHADILPPDLANMVVDTMRAYGATTLGVVANVGRANPNGRAILGFISYGYAQALLRLDRIPEYLLFLYAHRFHDHTPGTWTAGEVAGITGGTATFCIPAQQTIPVMVRWMLALEDSDLSRLYLAKGIPSEWVISGKDIGITQAPTKWGRVDFRMRGDLAMKRVEADVKLAKSHSLKEIHLTIRLPAGNRLRTATINGKPAVIGGTQKDAVVVPAAGTQTFSILAQYD